MEQKKQVAKFGRGISMLIVCNLLELNEGAREELKRCDRYDFDIFNLRRESKGNEMVSLLGFLIAKRGLLGQTDLNFPKLLNFAYKL